MKCGTITSILSALILSVAMPSAAQSGDKLSDALQQCRQYADRNERLDCYDAIGIKAVTVEHATPDAVPEPDPAPAIAPADAPAPQAVADNIGLPKPVAEYESVRANVVRCGKANDHRFYFYFDNGQVWKYLGNRHLRYRNCDSPATLYEDGFGFALQLDGEKRKLRVQRVK